MIDFDATVLAAAHAAFGEVAAYLPGAGGLYTVSGIFDDKWVDDKLQDGMQSVGTRTVLNVRRSDLPCDPAQGDLLRIRGRVYAVTEPPEPDTYGDTRLYLRLADDAQALIALAAPVPTA